MTESELQRLIHEFRNHPHDPFRAFQLAQHFDKRGPSTDAYACGSKAYELALLAEKRGEPGIAEIHVWWARMQYEAQNFKQAALSAEHAIALKPDCAEAHYTLAICYFALSDSYTFACIATCENLKHLAPHKVYWADVKIAQCQARVHTRAWCEELPQYSRVHVSSPPNPEQVQETKRMIQESLRKLDSQVRI